MTKPVFNWTIETPRSWSQNSDLKFNIVHIQWWGGISQAQLKIANIWIETVQKIELIKLNLYSQIDVDRCLYPAQTLTPLKVTISKY